MIKAISFNKEACDFSHVRLHMSLSSWDEDEKEDALDSARGIIYDFYHSKYPKIDFGGESIIVKFINGKEIKIWNSEWAEITKNCKS